MLTKLRIKNFKSLGDTGEMAIRPLTFLVGPNSAGKSSVLQALLLLRQTVDERDATIPLKVNGPWVDLGSYVEFAHRRAEEKPGERAFGIEIAFDRPQLDAYHGTLDWSSLIEEGFSAHFSYDGQIYLDRSGYTSEPVWTIERKEGQKYQVGGQDVQPHKFYSFSPVQPPRVAVREKAKNSESALEGMSFLDDEFPYTLEMAMLLGEHLDIGLEDFFRRLYYLGPLRVPPKRQYEYSGSAPQDVGLAGERAIDVLIAGLKRDSEGSLAKVCEWLKALEVAANVQLQALTPTLYELRLVDKWTRLSVNYADVGFGASQTVPLIVMGFHAPAHATLLIEQPEIHLHPFAQARLADLLVAISKEQKTLIVETHSEHLLSRIQVQIAQGDLSRDDVAIYFFEPTPDGTRIVPIEINEFGQFGNFPPGFFDEGLKLADEHIRAVARAQGRDNGRD